MNVLTAGIILYSFYMSICSDQDGGSDNDPDEDDTFGATGGSMLPPHKPFSGIGSGLGSLSTGGYTSGDLQAKFPGLNKGKKPKEQSAGKPQQPKPIKSPLIPPDNASQGGAGGYGGGYPQGGYPQGAAGGYGGGSAGGYGYAGQPGGAGGGYPQGGASGGAGGYGGGASGGAGGYGAAYPPGYGQPGGAGPYGGGASGQGGGASGPGQPSGPTSQSSSGSNMLTIDVKNPNNGPNVIVDEYRAGKLNRRHRQFNPIPGCQIIQVNYDGGPVWTKEGEDNHAVQVVVYPLGFGEKFIVITMDGGDKVTFKKKGNGKPWEKQ